MPSLEHAVPLGERASAGQLVLTPSQFSSGSHSPVEARQSVPPFPAGCWQASLEPLHWSSVHGLPSLLHDVPEGDFASAGQLTLLPVQFSAGSHSPAEDRHVVVDGLSASAGQLPLLPVQTSCGSQMPAEARHSVPAVTNWQVDVQQEPGWPLFAPSSHCSPREESTVPFPHSETSVIVMTSPSFACVRDGRVPG